MSDELHPPKSSALRHLYWRGEILQLMYWLRGEGLGAAADAPPMERLLGLEASAGLGYLSQLVDDGHPDRRGAGSAALRAGRRGRRLAARMGRNARGGPPASRRLPGPLRRPYHRGARRSRSGTSVRIAIAGKGGAGKTTLSATLARLCGRAGYPVIAIDADPNPNLATALGVPHDAAPALPA